MPELQTIQGVFSERLRSLRSDYGLSTYAVAEVVLGARERASEVTKWETGRHFPSPEKLVKIAGLLRCSTDYLLGVSDIREKVPA